MKKKEVFKETFFIGFLIFVTFCSISCSSPIPEEPFRIEFGVCTNISDSALLDSCGYDYIEESVQQFLMPSEDEKKFNEMLLQNKFAAIPVRACNNFLPDSLKCVGSEADHPGILDFMETTFCRAQTAGVEYIIFDSCGSRRIPEGFMYEEAYRQFFELCRQMVVIAAKYEVVVVLKPLNANECNFINSVLEGGEFVERVNHPNFRLLADFYQMRIEKEGPENLIKYGHLIHHTHISEKEGRAAPGTHNEDFKAYFKALKNVGYEGKVSIECRWEDLEKQAPTAIAAMKNQIANLN